MSTVKYKASGRYEFGWSDPRKPGVYQKVYLSLKDMSMSIVKHFAHDMTTEQLRAAWKLQFGDRSVGTDTLAQDQDMLCIGQILYQRGQLLEQRRLETYSHCYALKPDADH